MPPLVSVVMNCYNSSRFLREAIDSVYAQTYDSWEIVLWDDGSTDDSRAIARAYDGRLRLFEGRHVGLGPARNLALAECCGDMVAFLDCDDVWMPRKLERQAPLFDDPGVALAFCDAYVIDERGRRLSRMFEAAPPARGRVFPQLMVSNFIPLVAAMVRRSVFADVGTFRELSYAEEYDLFLRIAADHSVDYVDEPLANYRVHLSNFSHKGDVVYREALQIREEWLGRIGPDDPAISTQIRRLLWEAHADYGWWLLMQGRNRDARRQASASLSMRPWQLRPLLTYAVGLLPALVSRPGLDALRRASHRPS